MQHLYTDAELNVSFPCWFNDSIIRVKKISELTRSNYRLEEDDEAGEELKEVKHYKFDKNGHVIRFEVEQYYDQKPISKVIFNYKKGKDEYGFAVVELDKKSYNAFESGYFRIYNKELYSDKFLVYTNIEQGTYLFYLMDKRNWGSVSVDTIANPTPEDIVVYGSPDWPNKSFRVKNTVNEFDVTELTYNPIYGFVDKMEFDKYPFRIKRSFKYGKDGHFESFIDSTFSGDQFLNRSVSMMAFDEKKLPSSLKREHYDAFGAEGFTEIEKYTYNYYEN